MTMICPCCKGSKVAPILGIACLWCNARGTVPAKTALAYADQLVTLAHGGYVMGDHEWETRNKMLQEAEAVRAHPKCRRLVESLREALDKHT